MHHIGILAGAALVTGTTGNLVFLLVRLIFSVLLLRRIHRRFNTWVAPAIARKACLPTLDRLCAGLAV